MLGFSKVNVIEKSTTNPSKHSSPRSSNTTTTTGPFLEIKGIMLQIDKPTRRVFIIGGLIRFLLPTIIFPQLTSILDSSILLSTPITSFKSIQESIFYFLHNIELYNGGVNHTPPILIVLLSFLGNINTSVNGWNKIGYDLLYTVIDLIIAYKIIIINRWYNNYRQQKRNTNNKKKEGVEEEEEEEGTSGKFDDYLIGCFYLFNPLIILTNLSHSSIIFSWIFIMESIIQIVQYENIARSMISLAIASYLSFSSIYLLPSILALGHVIIRDKAISAKQHQEKKEGEEDKEQTNVKDLIVKLYVEGLAIFIICVILLIMISFIITASWQFLDNVYLTIILFKNPIPNIGLWWYIFIEMFENYTSFYLIVFNVYTWIFILPFTIRFFQYKNNKITSLLGDSFLAVILCLCWISFIKPYPILGDLGIVLSLLPILNDTIVQYCKLKYITGMTLIIGLLLAPIFYYIWIVLGTGNANFFYSITLIWGAIHGLILMDLIWTKLTLDYYNDNGIDINGEGGSLSLSLAQI